jgi:hypothetical protein
MDENNKAGKSGLELAGQKRDSDYRYGTASRRMGAALDWEVPAGNGGISKYIAGITAGMNADKKI